MAPWDGRLSGRAFCLLSLVWEEVAKKGKAMGKVYKNKKSGGCSLCKPHKHKKAQEEDMKVGQEAGADAYLTKPFNSQELLEKIRGLLSQSPKS